MKRDYIALTQF